MQDKSWLLGKEKDIKKKLADKLLDGSITYAEKELIACYLVSESIIEQALAVVCRKYWKKESITLLEKELLSILIPKKGRGRKKGTDRNNLMLCLWFEVIRSDCKTDTEAREAMRQLLAKADECKHIDTGTLRKRIEAGKKALEQPAIEPIAESLKNTRDNEIIKAAILEIK